ncbi:MAG: c-type cytochrome [Bacteroidia bacterium]
MKTRPTLSEQIEQYLHNELSDADKKEFETKLSQDASLKAEVENYQLLMKGIQRSALKQMIQKKFRSYQLGKVILKTTLVVLTAAALGTAIYFGTKNSHKSPNAYSNEETSSLPALNEEGKAEWSDADKNLPSTVFNLNGSKDTVIESKNGIILAIPAGTFVDEDNQPVNGPVRLDLKEALDPASILKGGLSTKSGDQQLETGGMFNINAHSGDKQLKIAIGKSITAQVPADHKDPRMQVYDGKRKSDGTIDWVNPKPLEHFLVPVDILSLNFYPPNYLDTLGGMGYNRKDKRFTDSLYYSFAYTKVLYALTESYNKKDTAPSMEENISRGRNLFYANCAMCHRASKERLTGPGLEGVRNRIPKGDWIYEYIHNSDAVLKSGDAYAKKIFNENNGLVMTANPALTKEDIDNILAFTDMVNSQKGNGIDPAKIKAIWDKKFQNTLLSTREFEERIPAIHKSCNNSILDLYVNNLDKNMWELDSMAARMLPDADNDLVSDADRFKAFAARRDGKVKIGDKKANMLKAWFEKKAKLYNDMISKTQQEFWDKQNKLNSIAVDKRERNYEKDIARRTSNFRNEYLINMKEACRQLGWGCDTAPKPAYYTAGITSLGWKNVDKVLAEAVFTSTSTRTTLDYTDPNSGKKAIIRYEELKVTIGNVNDFDRVYVYLIPDLLHSFMRLESSGGVFKEKLNELISNKLVAVGYKNDEVYYEVMEKVKPGSITMNPKKGSDRELSALLNTDGNYTTKVDQLKQEMEFQKFVVQDEKRQIKLAKLEDLRYRIQLVVLPCMPVPEVA